MTIVDASAVIQMISSEVADELLRKRLSPPRCLHAPDLIDAEVLNAVRGMLLGGKVTLTRAIKMLDEFAGMRNLVRHSAKLYLRRVIELRHNFTAYDALYVALAEKLGLPLLTTDRKYGRAAGHGADVQVYP